MAAQMLLINPKRRRRRKAARSARRVRARRYVRRVTRARRRRAHRNPLAMTRRRRRHVARRAHVNPRRRRRLHRNPFGRMGGIFSTEVVPAGIGAVGAVGMDVIWGYLTQMLGPQAATITGNPWLNATAKGAGAVGLGMLASKALGRERGRAVAVGALTVIAYELVSGLVKQMAPTVPMAGIGAYMPSLGAYQPPSNLSGELPLMRGEPVRLNGLGEYNPAPMLRGMGEVAPSAAVMPYGYAGPTMSGLDGSTGDLSGMGMGF